MERIYGPVVVWLGEHGVGKGLGRAIDLEVGFCITSG